MKRKKNEIQLWTDGGCRFNSQNGGVQPDDVSGWAALLLFNEHEKMISGADLGKTNQYMEINAVLQGLKSIKNRDYPISIFTDSKFVVNTLNSKWYVGWQKRNWKTRKKTDVSHRELWEEIIEIWESLPEARIQHVKGHSGIENNERVDKEVNKQMDLLNHIENFKPQGEI